MISSDNYDSYEILDRMLQCTETEYDPEKDEYVDVYDNALPLRDIRSGGGIRFPNIQGIISAFAAGEDVYVGRFGNTEVYLLADVGHEMYQESSYAVMSLITWTEIDPNEMDLGGSLFEVEARWNHESDPPSDEAARKVLRWLYERLQDEWNRAYDEACSVMGI